MTDDINAPDPLSSGSISGVKSSAVHDGKSQNQIDQCWGRVNQRMRQDIGDAAWRNWIKPLRVSRLQDGTLTLE
ncbi:MAG: DnaA N-terminal domain-containing protein, partial [Candidatus Puniceispirillum sp.]